MPTQAQIALQMIQQLRLLDPSVSAEIGTPERKIIDTVAQSIANAQLNIDQLQGAFDLDAKFGDDLDGFLAVFGFGRQQGASARGYAKFSRTVASAFPIPIPRNTRILAPTVELDGGGVGSVNFLTTQFGEIPAGDLEVVVPITAAIVGTIGNVAAGVITEFSGTPTVGVTAVINEVPTSGGVNPESDAEFKVRFKNTVFRNLAGTYDQFLALAVSTQFTTKANVVGPISRYREHIQVPDVDDASADPDTATTGNGNAGEWTTALSTIPYSKHIYDSIPYFVANGEVGTTAVFFRRDTDFRLNTSDVTRDRGDTYRGRINGDDSQDVVANDDTDFQPNLTLYNVYEGDDETIQTLRPQDIVLFEHSYMSSVSRNDWDRQILNCVDVFINGENPTQADAIIVRPSGSTNPFSGNAANRLYIDNFRRIGEAEHRPVIGNIFSGLYWSPLSDLPDTIVTTEGTFLKGTHYWAIEDVSDIGRSVRARTGIEWNPTVRSRAINDPTDGDFTGAKITELADDPLTISAYTYDRNIVDLQAALEGNKQVTTDVLAHQANTRFFKLDITVMYNRGISQSAVNSAISSQVSSFLNSLYFGTAIQLSDLLQVIHNVNGVDNVRWSRDLLENRLVGGGSGFDNDGKPRTRIIECDINGTPIASPIIDRRVYGTTSPAVTEVQQFYLGGEPTAGTYILSQNGVPSDPINWNDNAAAVYTATQGNGWPINNPITGSGTPTSPFVITFSSTGYRDLIEVDDNDLVGGTSFDTDFFLSDDELPALPTGTVSGDTVPGLIIRPRAQNVWNQL